jgi:hypothetical protein
MWKTLCKVLPSVHSDIDEYHAKLNNAKVYDDPYDNNNESSIVEDESMQI